MPIACIRTAWAGTSGGPGVNQLFLQQTGTFGQLTTTEAQNAVNAVRAFWFAVNGLIPNEITLTTSTVVDHYDVTDGSLVYSTTAPTAPATVAGTDTGSYSMAAGIKTQLQTGIIRNGRRVRGAIYIVPAASSAMSALGTVGSTQRTTVNTAGSTLISTLASAGMQLVVYGRPLKNEVGVVTRLGAATVVSGFETSEKGAVLRGRRD